MVPMTRESAPIEEWYDGDRPARTTARLFSEQRWHLTGAAAAYAVKHSPV